MPKRSIQLRIAVAAGAALAMVIAAACNPAPGVNASPAAVKTAALPSPGDKARPNIIFILVDTLRADRIGAWGHPGKLTPNIDALAAEGAVFERAIAPAPWTLPAVASIFTGEAPCVHKTNVYKEVEGMEQGQRPVLPVLDDSFLTLAERLQQAGYQTVGVCGNKFVQEKYGFAQGFEHFDTSFVANNVSADKINAAAKKWIDEKRDPARPLFLYLHYMDPHAPYDAARQFHDPLVNAVEKLPNKTQLTQQQFFQINLYIRAAPAWAESSEQFERLRYFREYWVARYEAGVAQFDHHLAGLREDLKPRGLWDDALIIFTADHGEALGDHTLFNGWTVWDHGMTQHQTDLHVPLAIRWPGRVTAGQRIRQTAGTIGLHSTLVELLGLPLDAGLAAESLAGHLTGAPRSTAVVADALKVTNQMRQFAAVQDHWKLIQTVTKNRQGNDKLMNQLFDLEADPGETKDLSALQPERLRELQEMLGQYGAYCRNPPKRVEPKQAEVTSEEAGVLKTLGYTGTERDADEGDGPSASQPTSSSAPTSQPDAGAP